jgi:hypothetical protein
MKATAVMISAIGLACITGCESQSQPTSSQNSTMATPYTSGSGVSSSGFNSKPRFYTGPNGNPDAAPATQPAAHDDKD